MNNLDDLKMRLEEKLVAAEEQKRAKHQKKHHREMEINERQEQFKQIVEPMMAEIIAPRLKQLASYFDNAEFMEEAGRSRLHRKLHFRHTKRFPASTKLEVSIGCDASVENIIISCNVEILPVIVQFDRHQEITFPLDGLKEEQLTSWFDERLCQFVDSYLKMEQAEEYQADRLATDPVCGMRVVKTFAEAQMEYNGQTFYFCMEACQRQFAENPKRYSAGSVD